MDAAHEFLLMGGYGFYLRSACATAFIVVAGNVVVPVLRRRELRARLARQARMEQQQ